MNSSAAATHRLALSSVEWAVLVERTGLTPPVGFEADSGMDKASLQAAADALLRRGVLIANLDAAQDALHPSVLANLRTLATPQMAVRLELAVQSRSLLAVFAIQGPLGSSLLTLEEHAVELSMFPSMRLALELLRAVPVAPWQTPLTVRVHRAFAHQPQDGPLRGRLPLAVLAEYDSTAGFSSATDATEELTLTAAQAALAAEVSERTIGTLHCLVVGRVDDDDHTVLIGDVVWLVTDEGWLGLRPCPDGSNRQLVELVAVTHEQLAGWLAPYLARIVQAAADD